MKPKVGLFSQVFNWCDDF